MNFIQRLSYYGAGLLLGVIILFFFFSGKKTSCNYSPNSRVLKNIRIKKRLLSKESQAFLLSSNIDTSSISSILKKGKVDFSESNTKLDSCKVYSIKSAKKDSLQLKLLIKNCSKKATILMIETLSH